MKIEIKKSIKYLDYDVAIKFLEKRVEDVINGKKPELLWILEHKPIFTAGTSYKENEILNKSINLIKSSIEGLSRNILLSALNHAKEIKDYNGYTLSAQIKKINIPSIRLFKSLGFKETKNVSGLTTYESKLSSIIGCN